MEDNPTLYKLKELEYLERICERIGNISLMGGGSLLEHLGAILGTENQERARSSESGE